MFENLPQISKDSVEILLGKEIKEFVKQVKGNPIAAREQLEQELNEVAESNPYLAKAIRASGGVALETYEAEDILEPEVKEGLELFILRGVMLLCQLLDRAIWAQKMEQGMEKTKMPDESKTPQGKGAEMIDESDAAIIDEALAKLPQLLKGKGFTFVQRKGYKAFKAFPHSRRNWCQFNDGDVALRIRFPNREGKQKTWKLFARFDPSDPPPKPWDQPEKYQRKKAQWMLGGNDAWGVAYEDIKECAVRLTSEQIIQSLAKDLARSFQ